MTDDELRSALAALDPAPEGDSDVLQTLRAHIDTEPARPRRRWLDLAIAACLGAALVGGGGAVTSILTTSTADSASVESAPALQMADGPTPTDSLAKDAAAVVATEDVTGARDAFVARVLQAGGRVTGETIGGQLMPEMYPAPTSGATVAVEVPADSYDATLAYLRELGEVVQFDASSVDQGAEIADTQARIVALQASVDTLRGLLDEATSVTEVVRLENAITNRQAKLDGLRAQQRYLQDQVAEARFTARFVTPKDAAVLTGGSTSVWQQLRDGLVTAWLWVGRILLWTSPIWILGLLWWRRRR